MAPIMSIDEIFKEFEFNDKPDIMVQRYMVPIYANRARTALQNGKSAQK